jgi:pSer/pThr/pTyr-binding forkhead associated (FHA) protein
MAFLQIKKDGKEEVIALREEPFVIGRFSTCDYQIDDSELSRQHTQIEFHDGKYSVRDLGSRNGTMVNGEAIIEKPLEDGDIILLGVTELKFQEGPPPSGATEKSQPAPAASSPTDFILAGVEGEAVGEEYLIEKQDLTIGRRVTQTIVLEEHSVSGNHALLCVEDGHIKVYDWESRNGVFVNDMKIEGGHILNEGDVIQIENSKFEFRRRQKPNVPNTDVLQKEILGKEADLKQPPTVEQVAKDDTPKIAASQETPIKPQPVAAQDQSAPSHVRETPGSGVPVMKAPLPETPLQETPPPILPAPSVSVHPEVQASSGRMFLKAILIVVPIMIIAASAFVYVSNQQGAGQGGGENFLKKYKDAAIALEGAKEIMKDGNEELAAAQIQKGLDQTRVAISIYNEILGMSLNSSERSMAVKDLEDASKARAAFIKAVK